MPPGHYSLLQKGPQKESVAEAMTTGFYKESHQGPDSHILELKQSAIEAYKLQNKRFLGLWQGGIINLAENLKCWLNSLFAVQDSPLAVFILC